MEATLERARRETTQMNTRINAALKERGDRALARAGYTPSQAVRSLYAFAVEHEDDPQAITAMLSKKTTVEENARNGEREQKLAALDRAAHLVEDAFKVLGISAPEEIDNRPYKELRDDLMDDHFQEKGLL